MSTKPKAKTRERARSEAVACGYCHAQPGERCEGPEGFKCAPHSVRIARSNGLLPCPQRGSYARPRDGVAFSETEICALERTGGVP